MQICYGWARKPMNLSLEQRYQPEQLIARLGPSNPRSNSNYNSNPNSKSNTKSNSKIESKSSVKFNSDNSRLSKTTISHVSPLVWMPVWIHIDDQFVRLNSKEEVELACKLACIYHNGPDNKAPFCDDEDWQYISEKEAFLAGVRTPESESSTDEAESQ